MQSILGPRSKSKVLTGPKVDDESEKFTKDGFESLTDYISGKKNDTADGHQPKLETTGKQG